MANLDVLRIHVKQPLARIWRIATWIAKNSAKVATGDGRRLLVLYDLSSQPISFGDVLVIQAGALVLREEFGVERIDFAFAYDIKGPVVNPVFPAVTPDNIAAHVSSLMAVVQINPYLGSLLVFSSKADLVKYASDNRSEYVVWPNVVQFIAGDHPNNAVFNELVYPYFKKHGRVPRFSCRAYLNEWAMSFLRTHAKARAPVAVLFRNNKRWGQSRNLDPAIWLEFFRHCETRYPATFVIVSARSDLIEEFRDCPNVILAKDHGTGIEQDLALIESSTLLIGSSSGPGTIALFNEKPYCFFNSDIRDHEYEGSVREGEFTRFPFATNFQRFHKGRESLELLIAEFDRLWQAAETSEWLDPSDEAEQLPATISWLR